MLRFLLIVFWIWVWIPSVVEAQTDRLTLERYLEWEAVADPQISPDGQRIVYTRRWIDVQKDRWQSALWIMNADGSAQRFLVEGRAPQWSPDGRRIAFIADDAEGRPQIFVKWVDLPEPPTQLTRLREAPGSLRWSPDGRLIAFTMTVPYEVHWNVNLPKPPQGAQWTKAPRMVRRLHYRADQRGFMEEAYTHLFVIPAEGGTPRQLTEGTWHVGARFDGIPAEARLSWTPDGRAIIFDGFKASADSVDRNYRNAHLYKVDVESRQLEQLTRQPGRWTQPVLSPDGRYVAYIGYPETRQTYHAADLWLLDLQDNAPPRNLTRTLDRDVSNVHWAPDGRGVYFTIDDRGTRNVYFASVRGEVRRITEGAHMLTLTSLSRTGIAVGVQTSAHAPGDVVRFFLNAPNRIERLTAVNDDVLQGVKLGAVEEIWYPSRDGTPIQGWIVKPPDFDATRKYPLILDIHGGPHAMYNVGFNYAFQHFAASGYVVLYTNPRGSTGYGTAFGAAISQAYPGVDHEDLMAGVDTLLARGYIDPDRLFVTGCSGGGVLSSWAIGQTDRFAAAAVRCPVTNWISMAGTTDIPLFTFNWFDRPFWEDPEAWLRRSPLMLAGKVKTPTLLMTGELDLRTPMSQTEEYYVALKMQGVPVVLLRFYEEYHGTGSRPSNFLRTQAYILDWFEKKGRIPGVTVEAEQ
jgi:dipeptidyl aminopeptidase/acylaminoacyl peptidase